MKTIEEIPEAGLRVMRQVYDHDLMTEYAAVCREVFAAQQDEPRIFTRGIDSPTDIFAVQNISRSEVEAAHPVIEKVLAVVARPHKRSFNINLQQPGASQTFHADFAPSPVYLIYPEHEGVLDYVLKWTSQEEAEKHAEKIELQSGDIIELRRPSLMHRGRNTSSTPRITTSVY